MAAPPPDPLFSAVHADPSFWTTPHPDYVATMNIVGPASTDNMTTTLRKLHDLSMRHPAVLAYIPDDDPDIIHIGHTFTIFPSEPTNTSNIDNLGCVLVGDHRDAAQAVCLPKTAFGRGTGEVSCL